MQTSDIPAHVEDMGSSTYWCDVCTEQSGVDQTLYFLGRLSRKRWCPKCGTVELPC